MPTNLYSSDLNAVSDAQKQEQSLQDKINASPSYYGNTTPAASDVNLQTQLKSVQSSRQTAQDTLLKEEWYGPKATGTTTTAPPEESMLQRALNVLSLPNYAMVGTAEAITGKGAVPGYQNIVHNITTSKDTFGDLLRKYNVPGSVAAPAGFMMDVATDPLNWYTMGDAALLPRLVTGGIKGAGEEAGVGALKGVAEAAKSSILGKAADATTSTLAHWATSLGEKLPYVKDSEAVANVLGKLKKFSAGVTESVGKSGAEYNRIVGKDVLGGLADTAAKAEAGTLKRQVAKNWIQELGGTTEWLKNKPANLETVGLG